MSYEEPDTEVCEVCNAHEDLIHLPDARCCLALDLICKGCCSGCDINSICAIHEKVMKS